MCGLKTPRASLSLKGLPVYLASHEKQLSGATKTNNFVSTLFIHNHAQHKEIYRPHSCWSDEFGVYWRGKEGLLVLGLM